MVVIESTANGFEDFKERWDAAVAGENDFEPVFFAWFENPDYSMPVVPGTEWTPEERELRDAFRLTDERNALERAMLHFSHLDKETQRIDGNRYKITLHYEQEDETELLIRVLSFGPVLKVVFPEDFVKKLCERLEKQKRMRTQD